MWSLSLCQIFLIHFCAPYQRTCSTTLPSNWQDYLAPEVFQNSKNNQDLYDDRLAEGDIEGIEISSMKDAAANAADDRSLFWPDNTIPYEISRKQNSAFRARERQIIVQSMDLITRLTGGCVKFVHRTDEPDFITFRRNIQCSSSIGHIGGSQVVNLAPGCLVGHGSIQHELMHVLGFYHEQSRMDRDDFVFVNLENVDPADVPQFDKRHGETYGLPYDYESVMHYKHNAFAKNPDRPTIIPKIPGSRMGQTKTLSTVDILRIQKRFRCSTAAVLITDGTDGFCQMKIRMAVIIQNRIDTTDDVLADDGTAEDKSPQPSTPKQSTNGGLLKGLTKSIPASTKDSTTGATKLSTTAKPTEISTRTLTTEPKTEPTTTSATELTETTTGSTTTSTTKSAAAALAPERKSLVGVGSLCSTATVILEDGQFLEKDKSYYSASKTFRLILQSDNNLVLYRECDGQAVFAAETSKVQAPIVAALFDGNFVLYKRGTAVPLVPHWGTETGNYGDSQMCLADSGYFYLCSRQRGCYWRSEIQHTLHCNTTSNYLPPYKYTVIAKAGENITEKRTCSPNQKFDFSYIRPSVSAVRVCDNKRGFSPFVAADEISHVAVQSDGNLVIYGKVVKPLWSSHTWNPPRADAELRLYDNGFLYLCNVDGCYWQSSGFLDSCPMPDSIAN